MEIEQRGNSLFIKGISEREIKIPSQMYPLSGSWKFIYKDNTEAFDDSPESNRIREIFDGIEAGIGTCYTNTEKLMDALQEEGITNAEPHVGWMFINDERPIHHCFTIIEHHILDFAYRPTQFYLSELVGKNEEETRLLFTKKAAQIQGLPNSVKGTFGQLDTGVIIVAAPCRPSEGRKIYQKLIKAFPNHPCNKDIKNGRTKAQEMLIKEIESQDKNMR